MVWSMVFCMRNVPLKMPDPRAVSPSSYLYPEEPGVAAVDKTRSLPTKSGRVDRGGGQREREKRRRQRKGGSLGERSSRGGGGGRGTPDTDLDCHEEEEDEEEESQVISHRGQKSEDKDNGKCTQSLPKNVLRNSDRQEEVVATVPEVRHSRVKQRSKQLRSRTTQSERREEIEELDIHIPHSDSKTQEKVGGREGGRRKREGQREKERERKAEMKVKTRAAGPVVEDSGPEKRDRPPEKERERAPFSFLMPLQDGDAELSNAESGASGASGASFSDQVSVSAASVSGSTAGAPPGWGEPRELRGDPGSTQSWCPATHASHNPGPWRSTQSRGATYAGPGPWIKPSQQKLTQVLVGHRLRGGLDL